MAACMGEPVISSVIDVHNFEVTWVKILHYLITNHVIGI